MSDCVLFYLWEPHREDLIARHLFYMTQARTRLLSQFDDIEGDAKKAADEWLDSHGHLFDPERHDPGVFDERAYDESVSFYLLLEEMRNSTRLSVVAGMFHNWDKQLRDWLVRETLHWHGGAEVRAQIWAQDFVGLSDLFDSLGWAFRAKPYFPKLDACRLLVNVYKHGEGKSFKDLKARFPEYLEDPEALHILGRAYTNYTDLRVTDAQIQEFSDAIIAFWKDVPERTWDSGVGTMPQWFERAFMKDSKTCN